MKRILYILPLLLLLGLTACDDGPIKEKTRSFTDGRTARMDGTLTGLGTWPSRYTIAIAGFNDEDNYAIISKAISASNLDEEGNISITLSGIPEEVTRLEFCALNQLRQRVLTFLSEDISGSDDFITLNVGTMDVGMYATIQQQLLDASCTACHGASTFSAAGLNLTADHSYEAMVNQPSTKVPGLNLVTPGDAANSVFHLVLNSDVSAEWRQNHADMLNKERTAGLLTVIDDWINYGAQK